MSQNTPKHRLPTILELQAWASEQTRRGRHGVTAARRAARIWASLGFPELAEAIYSAL